jgi:hypothetical protein
MMAAPLTDAARATMGASATAADAARASMGASATVFDAARAFLGGAPAASDAARAFMGAPAGLFDAARAFTGAPTETAVDAARALVAARADGAVRAFMAVPAEDGESVRTDGSSVDGAFSAAVARHAESAGTAAELRAALAEEVARRMVVEAQAAAATARASAEIELERMRAALAVSDARAAASDLARRVAELELEKERAASANASVSEGGESAFSSSLAAASHPFFSRSVWSSASVGGNPDESGLTPGERAKRIMPCAHKLAERNGALDTATAVSLLWELESFGINNGFLPYDLTAYMTPSALEVARAIARESTGGTPRSTNEWVTWLQGYVASNGYTILEAVGMIKPFSLGGVTILSEESVTMSLGMHVSGIGRHLSGVRDAEWRKSGATGQVAMAVLNTLPERLQRMICDVLKISGARSVPVGLDYATMKTTILDALGRVVEETNKDWETRSAFVVELVKMRSAALNMAAASEDAAKKAAAAAAAARTASVWKGVPARSAAVAAGGAKQTTAMATVAGVQQGKPATAAAGAPVGGAGRCFNCGISGHVQRDCYKPARAATATAASTTARK